MSFYPQPNDYTCGPFSLKYAMNIFGVFISDGLIIEKSGARWWDGVDEVGLERAANFFNFKFKPFNTNNKTKAIKLLNEQLKNNYPCILSVDNWKHWITVVNNTKSEYVVINSGVSKVFYTLKTNELIDYWAYYNEESDFYSYDGYVVAPKFKTKIHATFTPKKAEILMYAENKDLAINWEDYYNDLSIFTTPLTDETIDFITFQNFLKKHAKYIIDKVIFWHGNISISELKKIVNNMEFVAEIYNFVVLKKNENKAVTDLALLLMMYACGTYGMSKFY
ncbi:MAG TPA: cysteine peptidase family C39 domain-containing protein [Melioribacteraceae bacterium]|nr:cysteine peptidase family C39 domain-containing protein [Melioribacteraceae bacterium]